MKMTSLKQATCSDEQGGSLWGHWVGVSCFPVNPRIPSNDAGLARRDSRVLQGGRDRSVTSLSTFGCVLIDTLWLDSRRLSSLKNGGRGQGHSVIVGLDCDPSLRNYLW